MELRDASKPTRKKTNEEYMAIQEEEARKLKKDRIMVQYGKHFDKKVLQREINVKLQAKLEQYDMEIEKRREK